MLSRVLQLLALATALSASLPALHVKVLTVDYDNGRVTLLLPMHNTQLQAELTPQEPEIRVRKGRFYKARFEPGEVNTVKRNILKIDVPDQRPVRFRIRKITFMEK